MCRSTNEQTNRLYLSSVYGFPKAFRCLVIWFFQMTYSCDRYFTLYTCIQSSIYIYICSKIAFGSKHTRSSFRISSKSTMAESVIASMESTALWPQNTEWHASFCSCDLTTHHCRPPTLTMRKKADIQAPPDHACSASCSSRR